MHDQCRLITAFQGVGDPLVVDVCAVVVVVDRQFVVSAGVVNHGRHKSVLRCLQYAQYGFVQCDLFRHVLILSCRSGAYNQGGFEYKAIGVYGIDCSTYLEYN